MTETENVTTKANKLDITIKDKKNTFKLIDMKVPADKNVPAAEFKELLKYKGVEIEVEKL